MPKKKIEIIYQNDEILVVNKPTGVSVTKDRTGSAQLTDLLVGQMDAEQIDALRLVHRLDKMTSGVFVLAKTKEAQSRYSSRFEKRLVKKDYLVIVTGPAMARSGKINAAIIHNRNNPALMTLTRAKGKRACTEWKLLADFGLTALLLVSPITGRTHQIRVHLPSIGMPLAIDPLYGSDRGIFLSDFKHGYRLTRGQTEKPLIERLTLHAYQINLNPDEKDRSETFVASLDKKFKAAIKMLAKHNPQGLDAFTNPDDFEKIINAEKI